MKSQAEKEYLEAFDQMPVEERRQHYLFALKFLADLLSLQVRAEDVPRLFTDKDVDAIDGDCTMDGIEL